MEPGGGGKKKEKKRKKERKKKKVSVCRRDSCYLKVYSYTQIVIAFIFLYFRWSSLRFVLVSKWTDGLGLSFTVECMECRVLWNTANQYYKVVPKISVCGWEYK
jgi:hypothetical protein